MWGSLSFFTMTFAKSLGMTCELASSMECVFLNPKRKKNKSGAVGVPHVTSPMLIHVVSCLGIGVGFAK